MDEFKKIQSDLRNVRKDREVERKAVFRSKEKLKKLQREKQQAVRSFGKNSNAYQALLRQETELKNAITTKKTRLADIWVEEGRVWGNFEAFTDPRLQLNQLSDDFPVLLFPVRLEARFKKIKTAGRNLQHQLWVRIFPDDCSVDTFDDTLTETELKKAQNYWTNIWKTGTAGSDGLKPYVQNKGKGAWQELMGIFNAGRAYWIKENYQPVNAEEIPTRNNETDKILVIPAEELPEAATQDALKVYWSAVFLANGNAEQVSNAFTTLVAALGISEENALQLVETHKPPNLEPGFDTVGSAPDVQVVFLLFPKSQEVDTKFAAWSQAARVTTFPERFVLLGYQKDVADPVLEELSELITDPLVVGPDPGIDIKQVLKEFYAESFENLTEDEKVEKYENLTKDEKAEKYVEYLSGRSETKWLFDFEEALSVGMGFKVDISQQVHDQGFERLFVLGVKLSADETDGQSSLEELIKNHHFGDSGFSILPQGVATNNTEDSKSGYSETEDADEAYERYHSVATPDDPTEETKKLDGRWLAELLGIGIEDSSLNLTAGYYQRDQCEARAMNTALWNATIGYFMESMLTPVFSDWQRNLTRWFLINHVSGRGRVPAIRIGDQPYGILPVTTVSDMGWLSQDDTKFSKEYSGYLPVLNQIYSVLLKVKEDWRDLLDQVAYVGKQGDVDAHQILLETLGLHPNSVEFDQRYAESFQHQFNWLKAYGVSDENYAGFLEGVYKKRGMDLLKNLGYNHNEKTDPKIPILEKFFLTKENDVNKPLIDDRELSEVDKIRAYTATGQNYIEWLIENAKNNHQNIKGQKEFIDKAPFALLYDMLRHSLNLGFGNTALNLYENAEILSEAQTNAARVDADFIGIRTQPVQMESKWDLIYREDNRIADNGILVADHISRLLRTQVINSQTQHLHEVIEALEHLKDTPTARLERVFVEHLDSCTYRLDVWLLGLVNLQLHAMRFGGVSNTEKAKQGIYLGAYGWLENLKPDDKTLTPVSLTEEMKDIFDPSGDKKPKTDDTNAGFVHAPSINHGLTAAVLRNAYISNASEEQAEPYKVNLSSERVRIALSIIEGIQQGQSLGALLGYQLERGMHDNNEEELDVYIYELRKMFSLLSNKMNFTKIKLGKTSEVPEEMQRFHEEEQEFEQDKAVTKIEARNVLNGLSLLDHIRKSGNENYPFGFPIGEGAGKLIFAPTPHADAIDAEVKRLMNIRDAVADLAMAEGVHQVVQGNYDRATGALDAYSKGGYPQLPEVVQSPGSGISLTHRFGIHLPSGLTPDAADTPRAQVEPAVNGWLEDIFPADLSKIACRVEYKLPDYEKTGPNPITKRTVSMSDMGLMPIDLLYMINVEGDKSLTVLDDYILKFVHATDTPRPDVDMEIKYTHTFDPADEIITFFEIAPLIESLRSLVVTSRPLLSTDIALQNDATEGQDSTSKIDRTRMVTAMQEIIDIVGHLETNVVSALTGLIEEEDFEATVANHKDDIIDKIDAVVGNFITHLHQLSQYGIPQSGFGFIYDRKSSIYSVVYKKVLDYRNRWLEKQIKYDDLIDSTQPQPPDFVETTDEEKYSILQRAERTISTQATIPLPGTVAAYKAMLDTKKGNFDEKLEAFQAFLAGNFPGLQELVNEAGALKANLGNFDLLLLDTDDEERQILVLAEDLYTQTQAVVAALKEKAGAVQVLLGREEASTKPKEKVKLLTQAAKGIFGEDFNIISEFILTETQGSELQNSFDDKNQLLNYQTTVQSSDFPVDEWLYGVARVREKMSAWENMVMLSEGFKDGVSLDLTPLQLPYVENDHWLGLSFPEDFEIESDKLLYTAYLPPSDPPTPPFATSKLQCGLLVDEWTEEIPAKEETTGLTFHYDRPNSEPPQTMLLVTPASFTGEWKWADIVKTMHETLDLAKLRAIEPDQVNKTTYAQFLPATVAAVTTYPVTMALNYAVQANQNFNFSGDDNG